MNLAPIISDKILLSHYKAIIFRSSFRSEFGIKSGLENIMDVSTLSQAFHFGNVVDIPQSKKLFRTLFIVGPIFRRNVGTVSYQKQQK